MWDPIIPTGKDFDEVIEEELSKSRCVIVVWTKRSIKSKYVKGEAREALNREILIPIEIESGIKPPFDFRSIQILSLINWDGSDNFPGFQKLITDVIRILGEPPVEEEKRKREKAEREAEKERRRKQEEKKKLQEEEQKRIEAARKAEEKRKFEKERERKEVKAKIKPDKPEPAKFKPSEPKPDAPATTEPKPLRPRKASNSLKFGVVAGVIVLMIAGIWLYIPESQKKKLRTQEPKPTKPLLITDTVTYSSGGIAGPMQSDPELEGIIRWDELCSDPLPQGSRIKEVDFYIEGDGQCSKAIPASRESFRSSDRVCWEWSFRPTTYVVPWGYCKAFLKVTYERLSKD